MKSKIKKIGLVGYLGYSVKNPIIGGQMSKTRGIYDELIKKYGSENICIVDTANWKKEKFLLLFRMIKIAVSCHPIIIMPNKNGIKIILPLYSILKKLYGYKIVYPVVGGWITGLLKRNRFLKKCIKRVDYILPETNALAEELRNFVNCKMDVMPIFSTRKPINEAQIQNNNEKVKKFCIFSRILPEKGIDEAIEAVNQTNSEGKKCHLDIWGPIDEKCTEHYQLLFEKNKNNITYQGILSSDENLDALGRYYMMLFPTYYQGEGFPTSICESFMAGLPVIASDWRFNNELIVDGTTGFLIPVHSVEKMAEKINYCISNDSEIMKMKMEVLKYSQNFMPEKVMEKMLVWIDKVRK